MGQEQAAGWVAVGVLVGIVLLSCVRALFRLVADSSRAATDARARLKSGEVRLGKISETLAPLLKDFPVDVRKAGTSTVFLGQPVDFIHFDPEDGVTFIEVKSGDAKVSTAQKKIRNQIERGGVRWAEFRVKGEK